LGDSPRASGPGLWPGLTQWVARLSLGGLGPSAIRQSVFVMSAALDHAVRSRHIRSNPARGLGPPRIQRRDYVFLTHGQVLDLSYEAGPWRLLILMLAYTALPSTAAPANASDALSSARSGFALTRCPRLSAPAGPQATYHGGRPEGWQRHPCRQQHRARAHGQAGDRGLTLTIIAWTGSRDGGLPVAPRALRYGRQRV
jgi:hypothetical protein